MKTKEEIQNMLDRIKEAGVEDVVDYAWIDALKWVLNNEQ